MRQAFCDEQGQISAPRVQSFACTILGIVVAVAGLIMVAYGVKDVSTYVGVVLGATFGKGASDLWAAQLKSGRVLAEQAKVQAAPLPPTSATASTTTATGDSTKAGGAA